jgi:hypothetical protein
MSLNNDGVMLLARVPVKRHMRCAGPLTKLPLLALPPPPRPPRYYPSLFFGELAKLTQDFLPKFETAYYLRSEFILSVA